MMKKIIKILIISLFGITAFFILLFTLLGLCGNVKLNSAQENFLLFLNEKFKNKLKVDYDKCDRRNLILRIATDTISESELILIHKLKNNYKIDSTS